MIFKTRPTQPIIMTISGSLMPGGCQVFERATRELRAILTLKADESFDRLQKNTDAQGE